MIRQRSPLAALSVFHRELGDVFRVNLPGFNPITLVGPEANRFVLVTQRDDLRWRAEHDPITRLLHDGLLVIDGEWHDTLRGLMNPAFHRRMLTGYIETMGCTTDQVSANWDNSPRDMLAEFRRITLLILVKTMFGADLSLEMDRLWPAVLRLLRYISPGFWLIWRDIPRPGYARARRQVDRYLYGLIQARREALLKSNTEPHDLLGVLITTPDLSDDLIRDQMLTMLIAGHDTSTALFAWTFALLGQHSEIHEKVVQEVNRAEGKYPLLDNVIKESLRLYPPIHIGNRRVAEEIEFAEGKVPAGERMFYSVYLTHRDPTIWENADQFCPERFAHGRKTPPMSYIPFGGGPRACIGAAFGQAEARIVLAHLLKNFRFEFTGHPIHAHMGATLEPRPGVRMRVFRRSRS
jgi:cytochrome P450